MNKKYKNNGFTLVELLIVVAIIAILASISFKAMSSINQRAAVARTTKRLTYIANALSDYYAEYGEYPQTEKNQTVTSKDWWSLGADKPENWDDLVQDIRKNGSDTFGEDHTKFANPPMKNRGLPYFFKHKLNNLKWESKYRSNIGYYEYDAIYSKSAPSFGTFFYTNKVLTIRDEWEHPFIYKCYPPYQSYILYSKGSNAGSEDKDAADDIYANEKF